MQYKLVLQYLQNSFIELVRGLSSSVEGEQGCGFVETRDLLVMRKLLRGGQVSITRAFADSNVERVLLQSSLYSDSVTQISPPRSFMEERFRKAGIRASNSGSVGRHGEHFATLGLSAAASKQEIKQAYRKLALVYHPDVCKGDHCALMFKQVNNAYEVALEAEEEQDSMAEEGQDSMAEEGQDSMAEEGDDCMDGFMGATDDSWEDWEEWMGWEGAGITDYSSHVNSSYGY